MTPQIIIRALFTIAVFITSSQALELFPVEECSDIHSDFSTGLDIPPFPNIFEAFSDFLAIDPSNTILKNQLVSEVNEPYDCNCTAVLVDNWDNFHRGCEDPECPVTTTARPTTEPTTVTEPITTPAATPTPTIVTERVPESTSAAAVPSTTTKHVTASHSTTIETDTKSSTAHAAVSSSATTSHTTAAPTETVGGVTTTTTEPVINTASSTNKEGDSSRSIIIAAACGLALLVLIVAVVLFTLRNRFHLTNSKRRLHKEKLARQRSDCQPLPENNHDDFSNLSPMPQKSFTGAFTNGCTNGGFLWKDPDSPDAVVMNNASGLLLSENKSNDFHYNTLKAASQPHTIQLGGFGESSTDATLPKKKKRGSSKYGKKTDANHNSKGSFGNNSIGGQSSSSSSPDSRKGSVKSKSSVRSKGSLSGMTSPAFITTPVLPKAPALPEGSSIHANLNRGNPAQNDDDNLLDSNNHHLFAYVNDAMTRSNPSLAGSELILAPPPQFQEIKSQDSPFNSIRREDPPTAVVRPTSVKDLKKEFESQSPKEEALKKTRDDSINISMEDLTPEVKDPQASFLWGGNGKPAAKVLPSQHNGMKKTIL